MNNQNKPKDDSVGALWEKQSQRGPYLSGSVKCGCGLDNKVVIFKNSYKTKDNQPDWKVLKQKPKEGYDKYIQDKEKIFDKYKPVEPGSLSPSTLFEEDVPF